MMPLSKGSSIITRSRRAITTRPIPTIFFLRTSRMTAKASWPTLSRHKSGTRAATDSAAGAASRRLSQPNRKANSCHKSQNKRHVNGDGVVTVGPFGCDRR